MRRSLPASRIRPHMRHARLLALAALSLGIAPAAHAQRLADGVSQALHWRMIGPHRGGRTKAATGVPGQPNVFYVGAVNGGVWKTTDFGRTWAPIFDSQPTGSIGAIAVAPSAPGTIYVGSGEGLQRPDLSTGNGIYKSTDGGTTWTHLGLRDGQQIPQIAVDPRDPNRLFVAVLGHPYGPNEERGLYRSTDGGQTFTKVLYKDEDTGAIDVVLDPKNPNVVYCALWAARQAPWENGAFQGPNSGLYKSSDGGATWTQLGGGLPTTKEGLGRIGIGIAPSDPNRLFVTTDVNGDGRVYRSDDAGAHWMRPTLDPRIATRPSDFAEIKVDPRDPNTVYSAAVVTWKSTDAGVTWSALRGAPGGDDYHRVWISPERPGTILIASDQGAIVTVNGGQTWSSWYNQPTAQFYHVSTDNAFPYRVCGAQQESGSVCIQSRGDYGAITFREWTPVGVEEYGYVAPDPLDPDLVYGGKVSRWDRRTRQVQQIAPKAFRSADYRVLRTAPVLFSPLNPHALYFASNVVWRTLNGGTSWTQLSPDLTRRQTTISDPAHRDSTAVPPSLGKYAESEPAKGKHPGVIYTLGLSPLTEQLIWAGTDDGLIQRTTDGGAHWTDVTPAAIRSKPWSKISLIEPSHTNPREAWAAVNTLRIDDLRPHVYRTRDGGSTWTETVAGMDSGATVNAVREDPKRPGLLYAGTETQVYVSFDAGDTWQPLRLNMPVTSIRDLVVKDDDLVVGTHGRSFWILDDLTPLRQLDATSASRDVALFKPALATRVRWNDNTDTPVPPDEPAGENPADGALVDYWLEAPASGPVTLDVMDPAGRLVRHYASTDPVHPIYDQGNVPRYWIRPDSVLGTTAGMHRFVWDLRWAAPMIDSSEESYPIAAIYEDTPRDPRGPWVVPGVYTLRLTANGRTVSEKLTVRMDPRVKAPAAALVRQLALSLQLRDAIGRSHEALEELHALRSTIRHGRAADSTLAPDLRALDDRVAAFEGTASTRPIDARAAGPRVTTPAPNLTALHEQLSQLYELAQGADAAPTTQASAAIADRLAALKTALARWDAEHDAVQAALRAGPVKGGM